MRARRRPTRTVWRFEGGLRLLGAEVIEPGSWANESVLALLGLGALPPRARRFRVGQLA